MSTRETPPRIGLPLGLDRAGRIRAGRDYAYLDEAYARALSEAGAAPCYLARQLPVALALDGLDGLLLPGGDDFPPPAPMPGVQFDPVPPEQLAFDRALLAGARERGLPILGICYGMQLIAWEAGGRLIHDLPSERPAAGPHRLPERDGRHPVALARGSRLAAVLGAETASVNSLHHQAVAEPGKGLRVAATGADGVIEAIEGEGDAFLVGVQWHPEKLPADERAPLFRAFAAACRARRARD